MGIGERMAILGIVPEGGAGGKGKPKNRTRGRKSRKRRNGRLARGLPASSASMSHGDASEGRSGAATAVSSTDLLPSGTPLSPHGVSLLRAAPRSASLQPMTSSSSDLGAAGDASEHAGRLQRIPDDFVLEPSQHLPGSPR